MLNIFRKKYDLIFSLGEACSSTFALRHSNLQNWSFPFDWLYGSKFEGRINILLSKFERFIEKEDLKSLNTTNGDLKNPCYPYYNKYNDITFNHDFKTCLSFDESYIQVKEKYNRRIERLFKLITNAKKILVVYVETPNCENKSDFEAVQKSFKLLQEKYSEKKIDLLYFSCDTNIPYKKRIIKKSQNIKYIKFNYKLMEENALPYSVETTLLRKILKGYRIK